MSESRLACGTGRGDQRLFLGLEKRGLDALRLVLRPEVEGFGPNGHRIVLDEQRLVDRVAGLERGDRGQHGDQGRREGNTAQESAVRVFLFAFFVDRISDAVELRVEFRTFRHRAIIGADHTRRYAGFDGPAGGLTYARRYALPAEPRPSGSRLAAPRQRLDEIV
jgi:hypothetical protein